jgi:hypothetical protein
MTHDDHLRQAVDQAPIHHPGAAEAECGCRVDIDGEEIHVYPCGNRDHEKALVWAVKDLAERSEIVYVELAP